MAHRSNSHSKTIGCPGDSLWGCDSFTWRLVWEKEAEHESSKPCLQLTLHFLHSLPLSGPGLAS